MPMLTIYHWADEAQVFYHSSASLYSVLQSNFIIIIIIISSSSSSSSSISSSSTKKKKLRSRQREDLQ